jgi:hypothetical protein
LCSILLGVLLEKHAFSVVGKTFAGEDRCKHYLQMEKPRNSYNVQRIANNCSSPSPAATLDDEKERFSRAAAIDCLLRRHHKEIFQLSDIRSWWTTTQKARVTLASCLSTSPDHNNRKLIRKDLREIS